EVVKQMNKHNILVDVSHLSDAGFKDLCSLTDYPFIASHSNCRSITNNPRNLTDDQIKEFIAREGLIGLNFYDAFVGKDKNDLKKHIDHFLELGAEKVLCMGSDFDGADIIYDIANFDGFYGLYDDMINWYGENITENIFYNNAKRFIKI
ncbi:MAG: membrane dipeptidase, partial [Oscillospiraceae bacterium]